MDVVHPNFSKIEFPKCPRRRPVPPYGLQEPHPAPAASRIPRRPVCRTTYILGRRKGETTRASQRQVVPRVYPAPTGARGSAAGVRGHNGVFFTCFSPGRKFLAAKNSKKYSFLDELAILFFINYVFKYFLIFSDFFQKRKKSAEKKSTWDENKKNRTTGVTHVLVTPPRPRQVARQRQGPDPRLRGAHRPDPWTPGIHPAESQSLEKTVR